MPDLRDGRGARQHQTKAKWRDAASASFFEKKEAKKLHPFGLGAAAPGEAHHPLSETPMVGGWASPVAARTEPKRTKVLFASFSFRKKKTLALALLFLAAG